MEQMENVNQVGKMPAGKYYLGDPCYVIHDELWPEFCNQIDDSRIRNGDIITFQNHPVFVTSTNYGDGVYQDQLLNFYGVDAGIIALVPLEICKKRTLENNFEGLGHAFEAANEITVAVTKGRHLPDGKNIYINDRVIKT